MSLDTIVSKDSNVAVLQIFYHNSKALDRRSESIASLWRLSKTGTTVSKEEAYLMYGSIQAVDDFDDFRELHHKV